MARGELAEGVGAEGRTVAKMEELLEVAPGRGPLVLLDLVVPQLGAILQVIGCHPHLLFLHDSLLMKIGVAVIEKDQRVRLAIKVREIHLLEFWRPVIVVFAGALLAARGG